MYPAFIHFAKHLFYEHFIVLCQGDIIDSSKDYIRANVLLLMLAPIVSAFVRIRLSCLKDALQLPQAVVTALSSNMQGEAPEVPCVHRIVMIAGVKLWSGRYLLLS